MEILNAIDDFSRVCVASKVFAVTSSPDVVATLYEAGAAWGLPASLLTDIQTRLVLQIRASSGRRVEDRRVRRPPATVA